MESIAALEFVGMVGLLNLRFGIFIKCRELGLELKTSYSHSNRERLTRLSFNPYSVSESSLKCSFVQDSFFSEENYLTQTPTPLLHLEALVPPSPIMKATPPEEVEECQMMITLRPSTIYQT